jgi:hypothetical protein
MEEFVQPLKYPPTVPLPVHQVKVEGGDVMVAVSQEIDYV